MLAMNPNNPLKKTEIPDQISMQIVLRLRQIIQELSKHSKFIQDNYSITIPQLLCLQEIHEHSPISIGALTKIVFMNNSTVTGIVDRLENRGLIRRNRISKDRRKIHLEVTDQGIEFVKKSPTPINERFIRRIKNLPEDQINNILWSLEALVDMLGEDKKKLDANEPPTHIMFPNDDMAQTPEI